MIDDEDQAPAPEWASSGYVIAARVFGTAPRSISRAEYEDLAQHAKDLMAIIELEESYDILIRNYVALEKAHAAALVDFMVTYPRSRLDYDRRRREADRQLVNLLASGEMYAEHLPRILKQRERAAKARGRPFPDSAVEVVESAAAEQQKRLLGVRALRAMRDHVLHLSLPVKGWIQNSAWVPHDGEEVLRFTFSVGLRPSSLADIAKAHPGLVAELEARADNSGRVAWLPLAREYVEGASYVHKAARDAVAGLEAQCLEVIGSAIEAYRGASSIAKDIKGMMTVAKVGPRWSLADEQAIDLDYKQQVDDLRMTNDAPLINLHRRQFMA